MGFGRILLNIYERRKSGEFENSNYGLTSLLGRALYIGIYRYISDSPEVNIDRLRQCDLLPTAPIMDNRFYYGEYKIIGNREVKPEEWEPIVIYSSHYNGPDIPETTYLQYGLIFIQRPTRKLNPFLKKDIIVHPIYRGGGIGFGIPHYSDLENIITENVNNDSLLTANDLRKKSNYYCPLNKESVSPTC